MKKFFTLLFVAVLSLTAANSGAAATTDVFGIANHLGVDLNLGTTGIGVELSTPITPYVQARAGISIMPGINFNVDTEVDVDTNNNEYGYEYSSTYDMELNGSLKRVQGSLIFNVYPFGARSSFFVAVGAYFGGSDLIKVTGSCPDAAGLSENGYVEIGDYRLPLDNEGNAKGSIRVNSFRPYFGLGSGRPCPSGRVSFMWEIGVQLHGKPYVWDGMNNQRVDLSGIDSDDTFQKIMDKVTIYPVIRLTISGRIF